MTDQNQVPEVIAAEMAKDREFRREERQALTAIPAADLASVPQRMSFMPQSMGEAMQLATLMSRSNFVPGPLRGKEGDCLAIIMQAARWGMDPFAVANKSYFVKDGAPPAFESQLVNAVINSSGAILGRLKVYYSGEGERLICKVVGKLRADPDEEREKIQHIARVTVRNSPLWKSDPEQQLAYYTTRAWARLWAPEVIMGVYTPDELPPSPQSLPDAAGDRPRPTRSQMASEQSVENFGNRSETHHSPDGGNMVERDVNRAEQKRQPEEAKRQPETEQDRRAQELPQNVMEWDIWRVEVKAAIAKASTMEALQTAQAAEAGMLKSSPKDIREDLMKHFTDRAAEIAAGPDDGAAAGAGNDDAAAGDAS